jgi:uncharacterized protein YndB with AHSA1/START domain
MDAQHGSTTEPDLGPRVLDGDDESVAGDGGWTLDEEALARTDVDLDHPTETVWRALVDSERLGRWMGEGSDIEPWPGGRVAVDDPATGTPREGRVTKVDEGRRLDLEWWPEDDPDHRSDVSFVLAARPGGSTLTVIEVLPPPGAHRLRAMACAQAATSWRLAMLAVAGMGSGSLVARAGTARLPAAARG